jgi:hypothetical protein
LEIARQVGPFVWPKRGTAFAYPPSQPANYSAPLNLANSITAMEITDYIFKEREEVLLAGDYNAYRAHATRKLHKLRKKLGQATPKGRKYAAKPAVTAENVGSNVSYVFLLTSV